MQQWRNELERHDNDPLAHSEARDRGRVEYDLREGVQHGQIWKAIDAIRREVALNTRYRYLLTGAFAVLTFEASAIAGAFIYHALQSSR